MSSLAVGGFRSFYSVSWLLQRVAPTQTTVSPETCSYKTLNESVLFLTSEYSLRLFLSPLLEESPQTLRPPLPLLLLLFYTALTFLNSSSADVFSFPAVQLGL